VDLSEEPSQTIGEVAYRVRFDWPSDAPTPQGKLLVQYVDGGYVRSYLRVPVVAGVAQFKLTQRLDRGITLSPKELAGYTFSARVLPALGAIPEEVVQYTVDDLQAAGAIRIQLMNTIPKVETLVHVETLPSFWKVWGEAVDLWPGESYIKMPRGEDAQVLSPVPFGAKVRLTVRNGNMSYTSKTLVVKESEPVLNVTISLPDGESVAGQVLQSSGEPAAGVEVKLNLVYDVTRGSFSTSHFWARTDAEGHFRFDRVNFDATGTYYLHIEGSEHTADLKYVLNAAADDLQLRLLAAPPLRLQFLDPKTGEPLVGYSVKAHQSDIPNNQRYLMHSLKTVRPTDEAGWTEFYGVPEVGIYDFTLWSPAGDRREIEVNLQGDASPLSDGVRSLVIEVPNV
jgi:hypothetical protein